MLNGDTLYVDDVLNPKVHEISTKVCLFRDVMHELTNELVQASEVGDSERHKYIIGQMDSTQKILWRLHRKLENGINR